MLFAWLCGFYVLPEGIATPYAATLTDDPHQISFVAGLLMGAMPTGTVVGAFLFSRYVSPSKRLRVMGWMAMLTCAPLIACAMRPPLAVVLVLWFISGVGGAYQLAANAAFVQCVPAERRGQAFGLVQSGLLAVQGSASSSAAPPPPSSAPNPWSHWPARRACSWPPRWPCCGPSPARRSS
nr:hypothetical protein GCM10020093_068150 [Planobispora longispora]